MLGTIDLQSKAAPERGRIEAYWFENQNTGLRRTLFHQIHLPLGSFDTGLEYVSQPEKTEICYDWLDLGLDDPSALNGLNLKTANYPNAEGSIYIGAAHNWIDFEDFSIHEAEAGLFKISAQMTVLFELEGVALNERFTLETEAKIDPTVREH